MGTILVGDEVTIVVDSSFTLKGHSVATDAVLSRTVMQMLGNINVTDFGYLESDFVTQFMPSNTLDTTNVTAADVDSLKLVMLVSTGSFTGDSLALMGLEVYPLVKQINAPMYSNFDPTGYYDSTPIGSKVYSLTKSSEPDSLQKNAYYTIGVNLPVEMGRKLFTEYVANPTAFSSPTAFAKIFPGLYIRNSYGSGRLTFIGNTTMQMFYHSNFVNDKGNDTTVYHVGNYFAVTPEIVTNNDISLRLAPSITDRMSQGQSLIVAPAGTEVELTFPAPELINTYKTGTASALGIVNNLALSIPVEEITNNSNIGAPQSVLLVLKKDRDSFFLENKLTDNLTSWTATLTQQADGSLAYTFPDLRQYLVNLIAKGEVTEEDYTFSLVPVTIMVESNNDYYGNTQSTVTSINPYVSAPCMARIMIENAKIYFVYSKQTTKI